MGKASPNALVAPVRFFAFIHNRGSFMILQIALGILLAVFLLNRFHAIWPKREEILWNFVEFLVYFLLFAFLIFCFFLKRSEDGVPLFFQFAFLIAGTSALFIIGPKLDKNWWNHKDSTFSEIAPTQLARRS